MIAPFVADLRTQGESIVVPGEGEKLNVRVQIAEIWETVGVAAPATASLASVKSAALAEVYPGGVASGEFVAKLRGFEILREDNSLASCGVKNGSTILLERRRRRPVR